MMTRSNLETQIRQLIEVKKLPFSEVVVRLGVSPTTVRRVCRTLKIGRYSEQVPSKLISNSSQVPFGWKTTNGVLEKDPNEWKWIEQMHQFRLEKKSFHWIARFMTQKGVKTKNGGQWFAKTISQILKRSKEFLK